MAKIHTDREILRCVYDMYLADYPAKGDPFVPVDFNAIAHTLGTSPQLLFGRLHYDMGTRLRHRSPTDPNVTLAAVFEVQAGDMRHVVNFPYMAAVLAGLEEQHRRHIWTIWLAGLAIIVAVGSALIQWVSS